MASRYFINGGVNSNWSSTTNWSASSGGAGGSSVPTSADDAFLDANSPSCTVDTTAACRQLDCTGYTQTLTLNAKLTATPQTGGAVTLAAAMTFAGTFALAIVGATSGTATLTSNGKTVNVPLILGGNGSTLTLADAWAVSGTLTLGSLGAAANLVLNGNSLTASGSIDVKDRIRGTTSVLFTGSGVTWTFFTNSWLRNAITVNTVGSIAVALSTADVIVDSLTVTAGTLTGAIAVSTVGSGASAYTFIG